MKKLVLKINMLDDGDKRKAMKTVAGFPGIGIDSISIDMKERKLTIMGTADPTKVVSRLRKYWTTELVSVGPAKEPEKEEPKKDETKKEEAAGDSKPAENEPKKEGGGEEKKKADQPKKGEEVEKEGDEGAKANVEAVSRGGEGGGAKKEEEEEKKVDPVLEMVKAYRAYNPQMTKYYYVQSMEENPNACVIC